MSGSGKEDEKVIVRRFLRMFELGDPSIADEIIATDYYSHDAPDPNLGREGLKAFVIGFKNGMPDAQVDIAYQVAEGDKVVSRYAWRGTHRGELFGVPATGKRVSWTVTATFKIADGEIREAWVNSDQWGLMQQLGVVPAPGG
ncbi:MAG: ester cyclase [Anaerolineae bacterium]